MDFDALLTRYFATTDLDAITPDALSAGLDRIRVDFGMERDSGRRFGLWALLHMLGEAPDLEVAFENPEDRDAARTLMDLADRVGD